jgi:hypothetical protein
MNVFRSEVGALYAAVQDSDSSRNGYLAIHKANGGFIYSDNPRLGNGRWHTTEFNNVRAEIVDLAGAINVINRRKKPSSHMGQIEDTYCDLYNSPREAIIHFDSSISPVDTWRIGVAKYPKGGYYVFYDNYTPIPGMEFYKTDIVWLTTDPVAIRDILGGYHADKGEVFDETMNEYDGW